MDLPCIPMSPSQVSELFALAIETARYLDAIDSGEAVDRDRLELASSVATELAWRTLGQNSNGHYIVPDPDTGLDYCLWDLIYELIQDNGSRAHGILVGGQ